MVWAPWWKRRSWAPPAVAISGAMPPADRITNRVCSSERSRASAARVPRMTARSQFLARSAVTRS